MLVNSWKNYVVYCFYNQIIVPKDLCSSDCGQHADDFQKWSTLEVGWKIGILNLQYAFHPNYERNLN